MTITPVNLAEDQRNAARFSPIQVGASIESSLYLDYQSNRIPGNVYKLRAIVEGIPRERRVLDFLDIERAPQ